MDTDTGAKIGGMNVEVREKTYPRYTRPYKYSYLKPSSKPQGTAVDITPKQAMAELTMIAIDCVVARSQECNIFCSRRVVLISTKASLGSRGAVNHA